MKQELDTYVVCIGASAGGLEAIEAFIKHLPEDSGAAYVVVQHLSPDYKSMMADILSKWTDIPVVQIEEGMQVIANHIYLIPPNRNVRIFNGLLLLTAKEESRRPNLPIDIFMNSLAEDCGSHAIGVVLSGTGSDGSNGMRMIKENLGFTIAQDEASAAFDGMPRSAVASGAVDVVLSPEEIPKKIIAYMHHPVKTRTELTTGPELPTLSKIFELIRERHSIDFSMYKPTTVMRRIERRIQICQCHDLNDYYRYLVVHTSEIDLLHSELLIGVTSFFRDSNVFNELQTRVIPDVIRDLPPEQGEVRVWCAACSSGEEAYSLAIAFLEAIRDSGKNLRLKMFATDVDEKAIARASRGIYPEGITQIVPEYQLGKYFAHDERGYKVTGKLREPIVFAQHNLLKDPPFTKIDFISCRNLLIYLLPPVQMRIIRSFNFSLNAHGVLLLGSSESLGDEANFFDPIDSSLKLYHSHGIRQTGDAILSFHQHQRQESASELLYSNKPEGRDFSYGRMIEQYVDLLADHFVDCSILVNQAMEIVHATGKTDRYLSYPRGRVRNDISRSLHRDLAIPVISGLNRLKKNGGDMLSTDVRSELAGDAGTLRVTVSLMHAKPGAGELFCIWIKRNTLPQPESVELFSPDSAMRHRITDLEQSLLLSQETVQATVEELETSNEELQATNEELLASNEELQSTNEELQSVNEELFTVNAEYQEKIQELTEAINDLDNFVSNIDVAIIYLDDQLKVRRFTDNASSFFNLRDIDIGRPISELAHNLQDTSLMEIVEKVNSDQTTRQINCFDRAGRSYLLKCSPYHLSAGIYAGVVLSLMHDEVSLVED